MSSSPCPPNGVGEAVTRLAPRSRAQRFPPGLRAGAAALTLWLAVAGSALAAQAGVGSANPATPPVSAVATSQAAAPAASVPVPAAPLPGPSSAGSSATCPTFAIDANGNTVRALGACPAPTPAKPAILAAPYHSQFDGSAYAETNCGPTALSMALGALKTDVDQLTLRRLANAQMGTSDPNSGTTWEALAYAAKAKGATASGLYAATGQGYRTWSIDDLKTALGQGHPVLLLVRYRDLPGHTQSTFNSDHFIVALGFDASGNLVYDDPAFSSQVGADRTMSPTVLGKAWSDTSEGLVQTAMALSV